MLLDQLVLPENKKLYEYINQKDIALIGPANSLKNKGDYIESLDTVCRVNRMVLCEELEQHYGHRCDVLFHCGSGISHIIFKNEKKQFFPSEKLEEEIKINRPSMAMFIRQVEISKEYIELCNKYDIYFCYSGMECKNSLHMTFPHGNSGIWTLMLLLKMNPKTIFMGGFDFYQNQECYFKTPDDFKKYTINENKNYTGSNIIEDYGGHDMIQHMRFFKDLYKEYSDILRLDDFLENRIIGDICKRI